MMSEAETGPELVRLLGGWLEGTGITLLELRTAGETVRLVRPGDVPPVPEAAVPVTSSGVGVFLDRHPLRPEPLAAPGQAVRAGDVVGLLRVGSLLLHVTAPVDGTVAEVAATVGSTVGYGTALLHLQRSTIG